MGFANHLSTFAGLPVVAFPSDPRAPLPPEAESGERVAWRLDPMKRRLRAALPDVEIDWSFPNQIFNVSPGYRYIAVSE